MPDPIIFPVPDPSIRDPKNFNSVWFEWRDDKDEAASEAAGHPVFDSVVLAHIMGPGMQRSEATKVVLRKKPDGTIAEHAQHLKPQLDAFLKGDPGHLAGTPLTELTMLDAGTVATLKAMAVHNLELLAGMSETAAPGFLGFRKYKTAAIALLEQRAGQEPLNKLAAENERLRLELETLRTNHEDLLGRVRDLEDTKARKRAA